MTIRKNDIILIFHIVCFFKIFREKHIEKNFCIYYNAVRQKEITSPFGQKNESPDRIAVQFGDSSFLL